MMRSALLQVSFTWSDGEGCGDRGGKGRVLLSAVLDVSWHTARQKSQRRKQDEKFKLGLRESQRGVGTEDSIVELV